MSLYLMFAYAGGHVDAWIRQSYAKAGKRLDMGKCCLRFRSLEEIDLEIVAEAVRRLPAATYLTNYVKLAGPGAWKGSKAKGATKPPRR